jgi:hypothetical protein
LFLGSAQRNVENTPIDVNRWLDNLECQIYIMLLEACVSQNIEFCEATAR